MADADASLALAAEFPPADRDAWLKIAGDIERLRTSTYDGITIEPLYTAADTPAGAGLQEVAPLVRGRTPGGTLGGWDIRQLVDLRRGPRAALVELEHGASSVWLRVGANDAADEMALGSVLDGVLFDVAPIVLDAGPQWVEASRSLRAVWARHESDPAENRGSLGADPFGHWAIDRHDATLDAQLGVLVDDARAVASMHPNVRLATIDGSRFHDTGASDAQELGDTTAAVVASLRALADDGGLDVDAALAAVEVRLAATVDQFATIAKFRAMRLLLARVAEIAGAPHAAGQVPLHAVTSRAMTTRYEPAVNIVRATVACFAAATGGADAITVLPHDIHAAATASELGRRLARNTQAVLEMESNIAGVIDPAGGSWYVERLTEQLADRAWDVFQEIESAGGFRAAVEAGIVDDRIASTRRARRDDVDHRRALIVGVTAFPAVDGAAPTDAEADTTIHGWAADFEDLRARVEGAADGRRPTVFLAALGSPAACAAHLSGAANFFAIAGLGTARVAAAIDVRKIADAFAASGTTVAFACHGDDSGGSLDDLRAALVAAGATRVYSASDLGGDVRGLLADLLDHLQVP